MLSLDTNNQTNEIKMTVHRIQLNTKLLFARSVKYLRLYYRTDCTRLTRIPVYSSNGRGFTFPNALCVSAHLCICVCEHFPFDRYIYICMKLNVVFALLRYFIQSAIAARNRMEFAAHSKGKAKARAKECACS